VFWSSCPEKKAKKGPKITPKNIFLFDSFFFAAAVLTVVFTLQPPAHQFQPKPGTPRPPEKPPGPPVNPLPTPHCFFGSKNCLGLDFLFRLLLGGGPTGHAPLRYQMVFPPPPPLTKRGLYSGENFRFFLLSPNPNPPHPTKKNPPTATCPPRAGFLATPQTKRSGSFDFFHPPPPSLSSVFCFPDGPIPPRLFFPLSFSSSLPGPFRHFRYNPSARPGDPELFS